MLYESGKLCSSSHMTDLPEPKDKRVAIMMTASELKVVDAWGFAHHIRSRGEVIRQLIALGL